MSGTFSAMPPTAAFAPTLVSKVIHSWYVASLIQTMVDKVD